MDIDNFKSINDTQGHDFGDRLLKAISGLLRSCLRRGDVVTRLAGDEFVMLMTDIRGMEDAAGAAERILGVFKKPLYIDEREVYITASIGIAAYPSDGADGQTLLRNADMAMYFAKDSGKNNYKLYTDEMNARMVQKLEMGNDLRKALERGEFTLFYQPLVDIATGRIIEMEALLRWFHPERGCVPPMEFIPVAEETGVMQHIERFVIRSACAQNKAWQEAGHPPVRMAVNLSAHQFQNEDLADTIREILGETGMNPEWLTLEITESAALQDMEVTIRVLGNLRRMGVQVALDDFGTGYSSLNYLKRLPIDKLKIDRSFIDDITPGCEGESIIKSVIMLARSMTLTVVAEGVETVEQYEFLKRQNCDLVQGYLLSKPMPPEKLGQVLHSGRLFPHGGE
jgi:diguanylate cyclase (GGDEF)-like protein